MNRFLLSLVAATFFALAACESTPDPITEPEPEPEPYFEPKPEPAPEPKLQGANFDKSKPPASRPWQAIERETISVPSYERPTFSAFMDGRVAKWREKLSPEFVPGKPHAMQNVKTSGSWWNGKANLKVESLPLSNGGWQAHGYGEATYNSNGAIFAKAYFREGQLHGPCILYREDGGLEKVICYNMGKDAGPYAEFKDGEVTTRGEYLNTGGTTEWQRWDAEGNLTERTLYNVVWKFENGTSTTSYQRQWVRYYKNEGQLTALWSYKDGEIHGDVVDWVDPKLDEDGNVTNQSSVGRLELQSWHDNRLHGWLTIYHPTGKYRVYDTWYEKGEQTGPFVEYRQDGEVKSRGQKRNAVSYGKWKTFDTSGNTREYTYDAEGKLHGVYVIRDRDGNVLEEFTYEHGVVKGIGVVSRTGDTIDKEFAADRSETWLGKGDADSDGRFTSEWVFNRMDGTLAAVGSYERGWRVGAWRFYHDDGTTVRTECGFVADKLNGDWKRFYPDGNPEEAGPYTNGVRTGTWTRWHANGQVSSTGKYAKTTYGNNHVTVDEWAYYRDDGTLREKGSFSKSGSRTGLWNKYDDEGVVSEILSYTAFGTPDGSIVRESGFEALPEGTDIDPEKMTGTWAWKNTVGNVTRRAVMINGEGAGLYQQFYANGQLGMEGELIGVLREGTWRIWTETGVLKEQADYVGDKMHGTYMSWRADGTKINEGAYTEGTKTGSWVTYHLDGTTMVTEHTFGPNGEDDGPHRAWTATGQQTVEGNYSAGKKQGAWKEWYPDGTPRLDTTYETGAVTGLHRTWHSNGKPSREGTYEDNKPVAQVKVWNEQGQQTQLENYDEQGRKHGKQQGWYTNGQLATESDYKEGVAHGAARAWYDDGQLKHERFYNDEGKPTGLWKEWNKDGSVKSETSHDAAPEEPDEEDDQAD